jgi:ATP-dependent DNA helicase RecG
VGRGENRSYCILVSNSKTKESRERMNVLTSTDDGFVVAEKDLEIRGPGEFFGTRQHGIPPLRVANLVKHIKVLMAVKEEATILMADDPELLKIKNRGLREKIDQFFQSATDIGL